MVTSVIGAEIGDEAVYQMVESLLPHVPILQVWKDNHITATDSRKAF